MAIIALSALTLTACGGSGVSEAELERERAQAAQDARQQAEIKALKRELRDKDKAAPEAPKGSSSPETPTAAPPTTTGQIPSNAYYCGSAYGAGSASCPFVENVNDDYYASGESTTFTSYSPTTGLTYTVTCNGDAPTVCTAGRAAVIYIP